MRVLRVRVIRTVPTEAVDVLRENSSGQAPALAGVERRKRTQIRPVHEMLRQGGILAGEDIQAFLSQAEHEHKYE